MADILIGAAVSLAFNAAINLLFPTVSEQTGPRLDDRNVVGSGYGAGIPEVWGRMRRPGNIIWAPPLREQRRTREYGGGLFAGTTRVTTYAYYATAAALVCAGDADMRPLRIWADKKLLWQAPDTSLHLAGDFVGGGSFEFMPGGPTQARSGVMEAVLGTADTPAYRGRCVLVVSELPLDDFGRRIPLFEVEVARGPANASAVISDVLLSLCARAGLAGGQVDVSAITAEVHGLALPPGPAATTIANIIGGLGIQAVCTGTQLAFRPLEQDVAAEIVADELARGDDRFPVRRLREDTLPRRVVVRHLDPDRDYQGGAQIDERQATRSVQTLTLDSPLAVTAAQAYSAANALLYRAWTARTQYGPFGLLPRHLALEPGDVLGAAIDGVSHQVRLRTVEIGAQCALQCEGEAYDAAVLTGSAGGNSGAFAGQQLPSYGTSTLTLLDVPALSDAEAQQVGYRVAATGSGSAWRSGTLEASVDGGSAWVAVAYVDGYTVMGYGGATPLPDPPEHVGAAQLDLASTVRVTLIKGSLASVSDELLLAGANMALVGDELLQFGTATLVSGTTYDLTRLLRGRRGTEWAMAGHDVDEPFVLLATAAFVPASVADLGVERQYRITPDGGEAGGAIAFTLRGASARPFSPVEVAGSRDGGLTLTITWTRRSRIGTELPDSGDIPLDEAAEAYAVDVLDGADVVRTLASSVPAVTYTAAEQAADFGAAQPAVSIRVYQLGQLVGRGTPAEATV